MSTTNGTMKSFKVTDKDGNVFIMTPVDTEARQAIDEAKNLQFDEDFFTSEVSQDESTVSVGLNGVPIGIDDDTPLKFVQDDSQGIVFGSDAPFATTIAPEYDSTSTYSKNDVRMYLGKRYVANTDISAAEEFNTAHWDEVPVESDIGIIKDGGTLTDAITVDVPNNSLSTLSTSQSTLTLNVNTDGIPNFAVEIIPSVNCTLSVQKTAGSVITALSHSVAGGNLLEAGKKYQVTCVGSCWTMAEFEIQTP